MPSVTYLPASQLKQALANMLHLPIAQLGPEWDTIVQECNQSAFLDVRGALIQRGYSAAQVGLWDRGAEFQRDIGLFWCLTKGVGLHNYDDKWVNKLDRRKELVDPGLLVEIAGITTNMNNQPQPIQAGNMSPGADIYWGYVSHWGWQGAYCDFDRLPPYPPGSGFIG